MFRNSTPEERGAAALVASPCSTGAKGPSVLASSPNPVNLSAPQRRALERRRKQRLRKRYFRALEKDQESEAHRLSLLLGVPPCLNDVVEEGLHRHSARQGLVPHCHAPTSARVNVDFAEPSRCTEPGNVWGHVDEFVPQVSREQFPMECSFMDIADHCHQPRAVHEPAVPRSIPNGQATGANFATCWRCPAHGLVRCPSSLGRNLSTMVWPRSVDQAHALMVAASVYGSAVGSGAPDRIWSSYAWALPAVDQRREPRCSGARQSSFRP